MYERQNNRTDNLSVAVNLSPVTLTIWKHVTSSKVPFQMRDPRYTKQTNEQFFLNQEYLQVFVYMKTLQHNHNLYQEKSTSEVINIT